MQDRVVDVAAWVGSRVLVFGNGLVGKYCSAEVDAGEGDELG